MYHLIGFTKAEFSTHYFLQNAKGELFRVDEFAGQRFMSVIDDFSFKFSENVLVNHDMNALEAAMNFPKQYVLRIPFNPTFNLLGYGQVNRELHCYFVEIEDTCYRLEIETNTMYKLSFATLNGGQVVTDQFTQEELHFILLYCEHTRLPSYLTFTLCKHDEIVTETDSSKEFRLIGYTVANRLRKHEENIAFRFVRDQNDVLYRIELTPNFKATLHVVEDEQYIFSKDDANVIEKFENNSLHAVIKQSVKGVKRISYNQKSREGKPKPYKPIVPGSFESLFQPINPRTYN